MTNYAGGLNFCKRSKQQGIPALEATTSTVGWNQNLIDTLNRITYNQGNLTTTFNQGGRQLSNSMKVHKANVIIDHKIDSVNSVKLTTNLAYTDSEQTSNTTSKTKKEDGGLIGEKAYPTR